MIEKITYDNGKIRSGFDTFKCENEADMERLCNTINSMFVENAIKTQQMETQLLLIKEVLDLRE